MHPILNRNLFFVKEHVGILKAANHYDIYDPETQQMILHCREKNMGFFTKMFRFTKYKKITPFEIDIKTVSGETVITCKKGTSWWLSTVEVMDGKGALIGKFKQKFFLMGARFQVLSATDQPLCILKGNWINWDFKFLSADKKEFAAVTKKWAGLAKELFTSADNYVLQISPEVPENHSLRILILAAVMCIDFVLKE